MRAVSLGLAGALMLAGVALTGCGEDGPTCGAGTVQEGGSCVPEGAQPTCGAGTVLQGGQCVPIGGEPDAVTDATPDPGPPDAGPDPEPEVEEEPDAPGLPDVSDASDATDEGPAELPPDVPCEPACDDKACGDDGCGGSCGECPVEAPFCHIGECVETCDADCTGKACGDDGCGGSCGSCEGGLSCSGIGQCVAEGWTCEPLFYGDGVHCDCKCGAPDPDCEIEGIEDIRGCEDAGLGATCEDDACVGGLDPELWTCPLSDWNDGGVCECGCGLPDPDCEDPALPVAGCGGSGCNPDGTCAECAPKCEGKACGSDGCGGQCGFCLEAPLLYCDFKTGTCIEGCVPSCAGKACGDDGCGDSCGECSGGEVCDLGACVDVPPQISCAGICGGTAPGGCSCEGSCKQFDNCCPDVDEVCGCLPSCVGKSCGSDGCGGSCGVCGEGQVCVSGNCAADLCAEDPCNGYGSCDPADGSCECAAGYEGAACDQCLPGYTGWPDCAFDYCSLDPCNGYGSCDPVDGSCECDPGFAGQGCDQCEPGKGTWPSCTP